MDHHEISKLLNDSTISRFVAKRWIEVNKLSNSQYSLNIKIRFYTPMVRSDLCNYSDACVVIKRNKNC